MKELNEVEMLRKFKKDSGYSYDRLSKELGVHYRTVYLWMSGKSKPSNMAKRIIRQFILTHT